MNKSNFKKKLYKNKKNALIDKQIFGNQFRKTRTNRGKYCKNPPRTDGQSLNRNGNLTSKIANLKTPGE